MNNKKVILKQIYVLKNVLLLEVKNQKELRVLKLKLKLLTMMIIKHIINKKSRNK